MACFDPKRLLGVRVLVVDDDEDTRELFALALQEAGADVRTASSASEGFDTVRDWPPAVMVSDLLMPAVDGFSLLRKVRSLHAARRIPAIAVSGMVCQEDRDAALAAGFDEHVAKPLGPDDLVMAVARWVERSA